MRKFLHMLGLATILAVSFIVGNAHAKALCDQPIGSTIVGTGADEKLVGSCEEDTISGKGGNDHVWSGKDMDHINGGQGDDIMHSSDAKGVGSEADRQDWVGGGPGYDTCYVSAEDTVLGCETVVLTD